MAEETIIGGYAPGIADWNKETTQQQVLGALKDANLLSEGMIKFLSAQGRGDKNAHQILKKTLDALQSIDNQTKTTRQDEKREKTDRQKFDTKNLSFLERLLVSSETRTKIAEKELAETKKLRQARVDELKAAGMSADEANLVERLEKFQTDLGAAGVAAGGAFGAAVAGLETYQGFIQTAAAERFEFAQELRQSGLAAGLNSAQASLTGFADIVRENNFLLGEAAKFTQQFSRSVGVIGVERALDFAQNMAEAGEGADMMRRFGLQFGEVAELSGTYLDTVRNLGMLDRMNDQQLRGGMENFMDTVVATSNVMKINLEDAAQMISETLGRDDIQNLIATLDTGQQAMVTEVAGMMGGMDGIGEFLAMRMAAGSEADFMRTGEYARLMSDPISAAYQPLIESLAQVAEIQGPEAFREYLSGIGPELQRIEDQLGSTTRALILDPNEAREGNAMMAAARRFRQNVGDADAGPAEISGDDVAVLNMGNIQRDSVRMIEGIQNSAVSAADLETNLGKINLANSRFLTELEATVINTEGLGGLVGDFKAALDTTITNLQTFAVGLLGDVTSMIGEEGEKVFAQNFDSNQIYNTEGVQEELPDPRSTDTPTSVNNLKDLLDRSTRVDENTIAYNPAIERMMEEIGLSNFSSLGDQYEGIEMETRDDMNERIANATENSSLSLIDAADQLKSIPRIIETEIRGTFSEMALLAADPQLHSEFTQAITDKIEELQEADRDKGFSEEGIRNRQRSYEMEARNAVLAEFANRINDSGAGNLVVETTERENPEFARMAEMARQMGLDPARLSEINRDTAVELADLIMRDPQNQGSMQYTMGLTPAGIQDLKELLGIGDTDRTLEEGDQTLALATSMIETMNQNGMMSKEQLERLIQLLDPETGGYRVRNRILDGMDDADVAKENQELSILVGALNRLVSTLQQ